MTSWSGGRFGERATCLLAPNANMMTLDGTNTWVLREPGATHSVVVDPGPEIVLLTHGHADHSESARTFAERMGCGVRALDRRHQLGDEGLGDGDVVEVDGLEIRIVATPGHTADSLSFVLPAERAVLTGDTVLGRGTSVVAHPDGQLGAYLDSLSRLHALASARELTTVWPGHGPVIDDALAVLDYYLAHRAERLDQVREALRDLTSSDPSTATHDVSRGDLARGDLAPGDVARGDLARAIVEQVYVDVDPVLWGAAELSVRAQLAYLLHR